MQANKYIGGKTDYLNVERAKQNGLLKKQLTIKAVTEETVKKSGEKDKQKLMLSFEECEDKLVLNTTNNSILIDAFGNETEDWEGNKITLNVTKVNFKGQMVDSLQVNVS